MLFLSAFLSYVGVCLCDDDVGYSLNVGNAIDIFANYGDLSQVTQVVSADYDAYADDNEIEPFNERNIKVFLNATSKELNSVGLQDRIRLRFCDTFEDLLDAYFDNFKIEGADKPWKAFMGDWRQEEILRTFGIEYNPEPKSCCYVLARISKTQRSVKMENLTDTVTLKNYIDKAVKILNASDTSEIRRFMRSYGTHYIESFSTGNVVYQVFKYKRSGYNVLKTYIKKRNQKKYTHTDDLRFYFSSYFLRQVGDIRIASGNNTVETWARLNLKDSQYLYSRPSLLRLYNVPTLLDKLNDMLDNGALVSLNLKTLRPIFKNETVAEKFAEVVENDLKLWEVNA